MKRKPLGQLPSSQSEIYNLYAQRGLDPSALMKKEQEAKQNYLASGQFDFGQASQSAMQAGQLNPAANAAQNSQAALSSAKSAFGAIQDLLKDPKFATSDLGKDFLKDQEEQQKKLEEEKRLNRSRIGLSTEPGTGRPVDPLTGEVQSEMKKISDLINKGGSISYFSGGFRPGEQLPQTSSANILPTGSYTINQRGERTPIEMTLTPLQQAQREWEQTTGHTGVGPMGAYGAYQESLTRTTDGRQIYRR